MAYKKDSFRSRSSLAIALIVASFLSAIFLAMFSHRGGSFWIATVDMSPGHQILRGDIELKHLDLNTSARIYLGTNARPLGQILVAKVVAGQILNSESVSRSRKVLAANAVPISIRSVDVAAGIEVGEEVDIYWVIDSQNGEPAVNPVMILGGVTLVSLDQKSKNFGSDAALTISLEASQVLHLLSATTHGRLVVVRSHV